MVLLMLASGCALDEAGLGNEPSGGLDAASDLDSTSDVITDSTTADAIVDAAIDAVADAPTEAAYDAGVEAGPILTITGGAYPILDPDAGACSMSGSATTFKLTNDRDAAIDLVWVDYQCNEQPYGVIAPLGQKTQGTYVTHVWRIRNDADKAFLAEFVLNAVATYTVTVD